MLLVLTYSCAARQSLRNVCRTHESTVIERFGRGALFAPTEWGAFLALRLHEKHEMNVQVDTTRPLDAITDVPARVQSAAVAYENRTQPTTPYAKFAVGTDHPALEEIARCSERAPYPPWLNHAPLG